MTEILLSFTKSQQKHPHGINKVRLLALKRPNSDEILEEIQCHLS